MSAYEITIAGFGGQGILLMGQLLSYSANKFGKHVSWLPSYGPEMRGGTANCNVVISDNEIYSPLVLEPSALIAMNKPSMDKFEPTIKEGGMMLLNKDMVDCAANRSDLEVFEVNADSIAQELGDTKVLNMVALGAFIGCTGIIPLDVVISCLEKVIPKHRIQMMELNRKALTSGYESVKKIGKEA